MQLLGSVRPFVGGLVLGLLVSGLALPGLLAEDQEAVGHLERAPGDLGELQIEGSVSLAADGSRLWVYETEGGTLRQFREDGDSRGKPVRLLNERGMPFEVPAPRLVVHRGRALVAGLTSAAVFKLNGDRMATSKALPLSLAASDFGTRGWLLALGQLGSNIRFAGEPAVSSDGTKERSRLVAVDHDLDVISTALPLEDDVPGSLAAARALRLAFDGENVWAAELANYRVYRLTEGLTLEETLEDPALFLEDGPTSEDDQPSEASEELPASMAEYLEQRPRDLVSGEKPRPQASVYRYSAVIQDVAWDPVSGQLLLLLAAGGAVSGPALDLLEPTTGEVRRLDLVAPEGSGDLPLAQLVVSEEYVWLRNLNGRSPTLRLHRSELVKATTVLEAESPPDDRQTANVGAVAEPPVDAGDGEPTPEVLKAPVGLSFPGAMPAPALFQSLGGLFFGGRVEVHPEIAGTFTGSLQGVTLEEALDTVCAAVRCRWALEGQPPELVVVPAGP